MAIIYTLPIKTNPVDTDKVLISDSEADNVTKQVTIANIKGATASGVSQIVAGTNVTISPVGGTGVVTINSSGGGAVSSVSAIAAGTSTGTPVVVTPTTGAVTVQSMAFAGDTNVGHVPSAGGAAAGAYLKNDGTWAVPPDTNTTYSAATSSTLGLLKIGSDTDLTATYETGTDGTGVSNRVYPVQFNSSNQAAVYVPWVNTAPIDSVSAGTSAVSTGSALTVSPTTGAVKVTSNAFGGLGNVGHVPTAASAGVGSYLSHTGAWAVPTNTTYNAMTTSTLGLGKLRYATGSTPAAEAQSTTANRTYGVTENASNQLVVNVPWVGGTSSGGESGGFPSTIPAASTASFTATYNNFHKVETSASNQNIVVTLPAAATADKTKIIGIKWTAEQGGGVSNTVTIKTPGAGVTIDGDTNSHTTGLALGAVNNYYELITDGANWWIK